MGMNISVKCPVCKNEQALYRDIVEAEYKTLDDIKYWRNNPPPFAKILGKGYEKYAIKHEQGRIDIRTNKMFWKFASCEDCMDSPERANKFTEYNPEGITIWRSQLP